MQLQSTRIRLQKFFGKISLTIRHRAKEDFGGRVRRIGCVKMIISMIGRVSAQKLALIRVKQSVGAATLL